MAAQPARRSEILCQEPASPYPNPKIGILYQNDDFGKDLIAGLKDGLGDRADKMIVSVQGFQPTDPTIDSQMVILQNAGADALFLSPTRSRRRRRSARCGI